MGLDMVGVRIPNSKLAISILEENGPMATTSVNDSGASPINEYDEIVNKYSSLVDKIYAPTEASSSIASTVVLLQGDNCKLVREGEISFADILKLRA